VKYIAFTCGSANANTSLNGERTHRPDTALDYWDGESEAQYWMVNGHRAENEP
jgi:hypothetical protein